MSNIFTLENIADFSEKINLDDLYEKKKQHDLNQLDLFNKILNRIHVRIKTTARQKINEPFCWFVVPEIIIGVPKYDQAACIAYVIDKLKDNGFAVRYIHPNALYICWNEFVPSYIRSEVKKKTGVIIDEYGRKVDDGEDKRGDGNGFSPFSVKDKETKDKSKNANANANAKKYTPIQSYKPRGNFIYDDDTLTQLGDKFST